MNHSDGESVDDEGCSETHDETDIAAECHDEGVDDGEGGYPVEPGCGFFEGSLGALEIEFVGSLHMGNGIRGYGISARLKECGKLVGICSHMTISICGSI